MMSYNNIPYHMHNHLRATAIAEIFGNSTHPNLHGAALFFETEFYGLLMQIEVFGLPDSALFLESGFFGLHIHEKGDCTPDFEFTGGHYNPSNQMHPFHIGDLPPLLSDHGYAWMVVYDGRIRTPDIIGKSLIIHSQRDDFSSQPSGDSGEKIGCGVIRAFSHKVS